MSRRILTPNVFFPIILVLSLLFFSFIIACEQNNPPEPTYYHLVHRENSDGTIDQWEVHTEIKPAGPCICWEDKNGGNLCISGPYITITPVKVDPIIIETPSEDKE